MVFEKIKFLAANIAPKPDEVTYWVDISANPYGGVIKYYDGYDWIKLDQDSIAEDYLKLRNKPTLNGVVIEGNKTSKDYNIPTPESVELVLNDFRNEINNIDEKVSNVSIKLDNYIETNEGNIEDIKQDIVNIQESLELILGESASEVIDKFNEILSFLEGYDDSQKLSEILSNLETKLTQLINNVEDDISLLEKEIKAALDSHINDYNNPHQVTKEQVGLDQVDNTSDLNKPISTLTQQALDYEANLRDEMDTELMNRINVLQGEIDSAGKKIVTDIIDITQNNTSGVQLNYKYKDRVSFDDKYSDEKSASVLLNNASSTNNGVMSKEDKKKFDSIDSKIINDITSITYEPSNIKINYGSQNLQDGVYVKSSETKIINSATTSSAGAMSSEDKQTLDAVKTTYIPLNQKGVANGVATLDENGLVPSNQLPSYVDDVIDCYAVYEKAEDGTLSNILLYSDSNHEYEIVGESGKIYVDITGTNSAYQFRWTGTQFAVVGAPTVIGEVTGTAFDGARGKALEDKTNAHIANTSNPHNVTVQQIGAIPTGGLKTINGNSLEGEGDIDLIYNADDILFTSDLTITANVGVHTVGSTGSKTLSTTGKSVKQVMDLLFASEKNPTITQPYVNLSSSSMGSKEVGTRISPSYSASLNAGTYQYGPATGVTVTTWTITDTNSGSKDTASGTFDEFQVTDSTQYRITAVAEHTEGTIPVTNLGNEYPSGQIQAGSKTKQVGTITGHRKTFYGTVESKDTTIDSALIRSLAGKSSGALSNGSTFSINIPIGAIRIIIAYPATLRDLTSVLDVNAFDTPIQSEFLKNKTSVQVEGANGYSAIEYKLFYMDYANANDTLNTYKVTI